MSTTIITQQQNTETTNPQESTLNGQTSQANPLELTRRDFLATIAIPFLTKELSQAREELAALTPAEPSTPIQEVQRNIDNAIDKLLAWKADLIRAQLAGLETVNLEDPDTGQLHAVALELAIESVEFLCEVSRGGAA